MHSKDDSNNPSDSNREHPVEDVITDLTHQTTINFEPQTESGKKFKTWFKKNFKYLFILLLLAILGILVVQKLNHLDKAVNGLENDNNKITSVIKKYVTAHTSNSTKEEPKFRDDTFIVINRDTLMDDMEKRFPHISKKIATTIIDTIIEESRKYNLNPLILYAIGVVESGHKYWVEHDQITLTYTEGGKEKKVNTRAAGWGGVVWEWHAKMLEEKGIATSRSELFYPDVNIRATAAIYKSFYDMELKDGTTNRDVSAQRRYFGGNYASYSDKIHSEVMAIVKSVIYKEPKPVKDVEQKENVK